MDISRHYQGTEGKIYFKKFAGLDVGRVHQTRYFRPYCRDDLDLLDFGCAEGLMLRSLPARRRIGVEVNPAAIEKCSGIDELHETLETVASASVDVVISNHCLEHVPAPIDAIRHVSRVLRPHGMALIVVPFDDWRGSRHLAWRPNDIDQHLHTWSPLNLGNLATEAGLRVRSCTLHTGAWHRLFFRLPHGVLFNTATWLLGYALNRREVFCVAST